MTISSDAPEKLYSGDGADTTWTVPATMELVSNASLEVYVGGTLQTITTHYTLDADPATVVTFVSAPPTGTNNIKLLRNVSRVQPDNYVTGSFPGDSVETRLDALVQMIQYVYNEIGKTLTTNESGLSIPAAIARHFIGFDTAGTAIELKKAAIPDWVTGTVYLSGELVINTTSIYKCNTGHTADSSFETDLDTNNYWDLIVGSRGVTGADGAIGAQGSPGSTGSTGATGPTGPAGSNGVFATIASQGTAETGTDNTEGMSPLRVKQSIDANPHANIATNAAAIAANTAARGALAIRVATLENSMGFDRPSGHQLINNNQSSAIALEGSLAPLDEGGVGSSFILNKVGAKSARVYCEVYRKDDAEVRASTAILILHNINDVWYLGEESRTILSGNPDGVTFSLTESGGVAQIHYTSDNMSGGNYDTTSYIRWKIDEISAP